MRRIRRVAVAVIVGAIVQPPFAAAAASETFQTTPIAVWVDSQVSLNGPDASKFPSGFAATVHAGVSARLLRKGLQVVSKPEAPHDVVVKIALRDLEWHFHLFGSWGDGTVAVAAESSDGRVLAEASRRFRSHEAWELDAKLEEAIQELSTARAVVSVARASVPAAVLPAATVSVAERRRRVAVLEFKGPFAPAILSGIADEARGAAAEALRTEQGVVMTRESLAVMLKDMGKAQAVCAEGECEVETGRIVGADLVVTGEIIRVDSTYVMILKLHETAGGSLLATRQARGENALELMGTVKAAAGTLFK